MTMNPIYPLHCVPCLAKRNCQSLPHSNNCDDQRATDTTGLIPRTFITREELRKLQSPNQDPAPPAPATTAPAAPSTATTSR
jgi:hypothetical protein